MDNNELLQSILALGAYKAGEVSCDEIQFNREFRKACEANSCGMFNRCWMCPPTVGDIDELIATAKGYKTAIVYQTVGELEDSFDFEGMQEVGNRQNLLSREVAKVLKKEIPQEHWLHLSAGGCRFCERCAKMDNEPCRSPDNALASLEAYGVAVSELAKLAGMKYINGQNTVTYFGAVMLR